MKRNGFIGKVNTKTLILILLIILLSFPALFALFQKGFFLTDDGEWMLIRLTSFYETLKTGQFPVRFIGRLNNTYGYPLTDFTYPGFLYLGALIHVIGFSFTTTLKIIIGLSLISSSVFSFLWLRKIFHDTEAFFGSLVTLYIPYHLYDVYKRGSTGEVMALGVIPFILWQIERRSIPWISIGIGVLILSHNIIAFICMPLLFLYIFLSQNSGVFLVRVKKTFTPFLFGLLISCFFWFPALYDLQYTVFRKTTVADWSQYFSSIELIGLSTIFFYIFGLLVHFFTKGIKDKYAQKVFWLFFLFGVLSTLAALPVSNYVWEISPAAFIQFPFRFLSILTVTTGAVVAYILFMFKGKIKKVVGTALLLLAFFSSQSFLFPQSFYDKGDMFYVTNFDTTTIKNEYMPVWVKKIPSEIPKQKVEILGKGMIQNLAYDARYVTFSILMERRGVVQINTLYFPGWTVHLDGNPVSISSFNEYGAMRFIVPSGTHNVSATFQETPVRTAANLVSLITALFLGIYILKNLYYEKKLV